MFPETQSVPMLAKSFLRVSGGVSFRYAIYILVKAFSPRERRCFLGRGVRREYS